MSIVERVVERARPAGERTRAASVHTQPPDERRPVDRADLAWTVFPAVVASGIALISVGPGRVAASAATVALVLVLVVLRSNRTTSRPRAVLVGIGVASGLLTAAGAASVGSTGPIRYASVLVVALFATVLLASGRIRPDADPRTSTVPIVERGSLLVPSAGVIALGCSAAVVFDGFDRGSIVIAFAIPLALCIFWGSNSDTGRVAAPAGRAVAAGLVAVVCATAGLPDRVPGTAPLAVGLVALGAVALLLWRSPDELARRFVAAPRGAEWLALVGLGFACGSGGSTVAIVALSIALVGTVANRVERSVTPTDAPPATSRRSSLRIVAALTAIGFLLRTFTHRGLWLDETTSVFQAKKPLIDMVRFIGETDNHPPLHHILLWFDIRLVGDSEFALRLPMMLMGAALIPMAFLIGRELFDRRVGIYAALFTTFAPVAVWYGQEARMYSQFMLLASVSTYGLVRVLKTGERKYWVIFTLSNVALIYTQYFAVLHVAATFVVLVIEIGRRRRAREAGALLRGSAASVVAHVLLLAPLVPYALSQAMRNQTEGFGFSTSGITPGSDVVPPPGIDGFLTNLQWVFLGYQPDGVSIRLVALWPVGLLVLLLLLGTPRRTSNRILLTIAGVPMLVVFGASFVAAQSRSLAEVRYFAGAVPLLLVLLAAGVAAVARTRTLQYAAVGSITAVMAVALVVQQLDSDNPRLYQYEEAVEQIRSEAEPGDQVVYAPQYFNYTLDYYDPTIPASPLEDGLPAADGHSVFIVEANSFADSADAEVRVDDAIADLVDRGMSIDGEYRFAQVTVWKIGPTT